MRVAIVIGVNKYIIQGYRSLISPIYDAEIFHTLISASSSYESKDTLLIKVSSKNFQRFGVNSVKNRIKKFLSRYEGVKVDELLFYYSGHGIRMDTGARGEDFHYVFTDGELSDIALNEILNPVKRTRAVKFIDACHSGLPMERANQIVLSSCSDSQQTREGITILSDFTFALIKVMFTKRNLGTRLSYNSLFNQVGEFLRTRREYISDLPTANYSTAATGNFITVTQTVIDAVHNKIFNIYQIRPDTISRIINALYVRNDLPKLTHFLLECYEHFSNFFLKILELPLGAQPISQDNGRRFRGLSKSLIKKIRLLVTRIVEIYRSDAISLQENSFPNPNLLYENMLFCAYFYYFIHDWEGARKIYSILINNKPEWDDSIIIPESRLHLQYGNTLLKISMIKGNYDMIDEIVSHLDRSRDLTRKKREKVAAWYNTALALRFNGELEDAIEAIDEAEKLYRQLMNKGEEVETFENTLNESILCRLSLFWRNTREGSAVVEKDLEEIKTKINDFGSYPDEIGWANYYLAIFRFIYSKAKGISQNYREEILDFLSKATRSGMDVEEELRKEQTFPEIAKDLEVILKE
ncbi:MAG: caspase family protein [Candidatus Thorarchaeota archaeon]